MPYIYTTQRLQILPVSITDGAFMLELLNTPGWLQFIGDRNVHSIAEAEAYIQRLIDNPAIEYLVVRLHDDDLPLGVISFIKRDHLPYNDLGFAFLPEHEGHGYAYEAAAGLLQMVKDKHEAIAAICLPNSTKSISLLQRLGFKFDEKIPDKGEEMMVYVWNR